MFPGRVAFRVRLLESVGIRSAAEPISFCLQVIWNPITLIFLLFRSDIRFGVGACATERDVPSCISISRLDVLVVSPMARKECTITGQILDWSTC